MSTAAENLREIPVRGAAENPHYVVVDAIVIAVADIVGSGLQRVMLTSIVHPASPNEVVLVMHILYGVHVVIALRYSPPASILYEDKISEILATQNMNVPCS